MIRGPSGTSREVITAFVIALKSLDQVNRSRTQLVAAEESVFRPNLAAAS